MAEIILPPEEETPQVPELNIDKPTENSKVITIEFEAKKTNKVSTKDTNQQLYTTDTDAWFEFKETSLEGANGTYSVVFRNRHDGSIFQRTGDVVNGVAYYKIPHQEIRHAGAWRGQIVYTLSNGDTTSREFGYDVKGHILDGKDVREIVVEDFETLMSQLRSMKDNAESELANLTQELRNTTDTAEQNETDRQALFDDLVEDIDGLQENYQELLDTGVLQTNINTKLEALEEEYAPKLTEVTAQLAQTDGRIANDRLFGNINSGVSLNVGARKSKRPLVTFIDDDGSEQVYTRLKPIFESKGVPCTLAIVSNWVGKDNVVSSGTHNAMTKEEILELQDLGWEIASHERNHIGMSSVTDEKIIEEEVTLSKKELLEMGFDVKNLVYPYGQVNNDVIKAVSRSYNVATITTIPTNDSTNKSPLNNYQLRRVALGSYASTPELDTLEHHKSVIDKAIAENSWVIFMTHVWAQSVEKDQMIAELIDYIQSKNVEIVNLNDGLEVFGDKVNINNSIRIDADDNLVFSNDKFVLGINDKLIKSATEADDIDFIRSNFKEGQVIHSYVSNGAGMPGNSNGVLITDLTRNSFGFILQTFRPRNSPLEYRRTYRDNFQWSRWAETVTTTVNEELGPVPGNGTKQVEIPLMGANRWDVVQVNPHYPPTSGVIWSAYSSPDKIFIRFANLTDSEKNIGGYPWRISLIQGRE